MHSQIASNEWKNATLQDYWLAAGVSEGDLIDVGGRLFTPYHCPYTNKEGEKSIKANWSSETWEYFENKLSKLALNAKATQFSGPNSGEPDLRVQLQGVVLRKLPVFGRPWFVCARNTYFSGKNPWRELQFGENCELTGAFLDGDVNLRYHDDLEVPILARSLINGSLTLLDESAFAVEEKHPKSVSLARAHIRGMLNGSRFHFDQLNCHKLIVDGNVFLHECIFRNAADMSHTGLLGDVIFRGSIFHHLADFSDALIGGDGESSSAVSFLQAHFFGLVTFEGAVFHGDCNFQQAVFDTRVSFEKIRFFSLKKFSFESAEFKAPLSFSPQNVPEKRSALDRTFIDAQMPHLIDCTSTDVFSLFSAFDGARFAGRVDFSPATLRDDMGFWEALRRAENWKRRSWKEWVHRVNAKGVRWAIRLAIRCRKYRRLNNIVTGRDARLRALEGGFRIIKQGAEVGRDRLREQRFYRYELRARRDNSQTPVWERLLSIMFGATSDYGASVSKPFFWFTGVYFLGALIYFLVYGGVRGQLETLFSFDIKKPIDKSVIEALILSGETMLRPFFIWAPRRDEADSVAATLLDNGPVGIIVRILASFQSFSAVILLFLVVLAVRRRFQLN